jgi:hypothetical protein
MWNTSKVISNANDIDFPTAEYMRKKQIVPSEEECTTLREISSLLYNTPKGNNVTYQGYISKFIKDFLEKKGFKVERCEQYNQSYTIISW